jgi:predicted naringenin-chalcone synthase
LTKILSIGTALPSFRHSQEEILHFMQLVFDLDLASQRKLKYLYKNSGISTRYSVIPDYGRPMSEWKFFPAGESLEPFPSLESRMNQYNRFAAALSVDAIRNCLSHTRTKPEDLTHLITVSCTGMSAPGLDLQVMDLMELSRSINRSSINFMGCYAALHGLKQAAAICKSDPEARVMVVCTELCTLHFQKTPTIDNITASMLFADGSAAVLIANDESEKGVEVKGFYSEVIPKGKKDMSWELSSSGFLMTLSGYVPELIETDFGPLLERALMKYSLRHEDIDAWCIHPGGKRILQAVEKSLNLESTALEAGYGVLDKYGNLSSPSVLFVLKSMLDRGAQGNILTAAFGPGLTMETCWLEAASR